MRSYQVEVKEAGGSWTAWLAETATTQAIFFGMEGKTYTFQVRATDNVGNVSGWVQSDPVVVYSVTRYYAFGGSKVAMQQGDVVYYLSGDHLGSTSLTTDDTKAVIAESRYLPYGQVRWNNGASVTDFGFTSQRAEASFGLMDYNARYYSSYLGRFVSPDSLVPDPISSGGFNRYRYTRNNPLNLVDPTGHYTVDPDTGECFGGDCDAFWDPPPPQEETPTDWPGGAIPTHVGLRIQLGVGGTFPFYVGGNASLSDSFYYNFASNEVGYSVDVAAGPQAGVPGLGGNISGGLLIGTNASSLDSIINGRSWEVISGDAYAIFGASASVSAPLENFDTQGILSGDAGFHVDPVYGEVPITSYYGGGVGGSYPLAIDGDVATGLSFSGGDSMKLPFNPIGEAARYTMLIGPLFNLVR